jgi:hypothetical protein
MKNFSFFVISIATSISANAQNAAPRNTSNSIYIDQVGERSTITLTQEGQGNEIGASEAARFVLKGNAQIFTVKQDGNNNVLTGSIEQADNVAYDTTVTGDNNTLEYDQGRSGSVADSTKTLTVTGNLNTLRFNQATDTSAINASQTIAVTGNTNTYTSTINANDVDNTVTVTGNSNAITMTQQGTAGKNVEMLLTGSSNNLTVNQKSTTNVDTIAIKSNSTGSTMVINQCNVGSVC